MQRTRKFEGQFVDTVTRLRELLASYQPSQILNELIQNADDIGASTVIFVLDSFVQKTSADTKVNKQ